jgi:hypothetical protein
VSPAPGGRALPTDEEMAAIMAAVEALWPRPVVVQQPATDNPWRFSGRTWARPLTARRDRPWVTLRP